MHVGYYNYNLVNQQNMEKYPYHLEFEYDPLEICDHIRAWLREELKLIEHVDYLYLVDDVFDFVLFVFLREEDAMATKMKWK